MRYSIDKSLLRVIEKKVWVNLGDMFIKMPKENVETMIKKGKSTPNHLTKKCFVIQLLTQPLRSLIVDQDTLDSEINDIRQTMKEKVVELEKLEGGDGSKSRAFQLNAMK